MGGVRMNFPIVNCNYKIDYVNLKGSTPHTHTVTSEIIQTFDNDGSILINGQLYKMQKNGLYFIHGLATHFVLPDDINHYNHSIIILDINEIEKLCKALDMKAEYDKIFTQKGGTFCSLSNESVIKADEIFLKVYNILNDTGEMKYAKLASLFTELLELGLKNMSSENNKDKISDIISYISDNALNKITIDDICTRSNLSKYHLCRIFKENIGVTIGEFIKSRRLSAAKQLLANTNMSITSIAYKCCFTDSSFFSKTFSKEFGITPTAFRAKYR